MSPRKHQIRACTKTASLQRNPDGTAEAQKVKLWPGTHTEAQLSGIAAVVSFTLLTGTERRVMSLSLLLLSLYPQQLGHAVL